MLYRATTIFVFALLICLAPVAALAMTPYSQDFESLDINDPSALANDGWVVYGNVYSPTMTYLYGYGPYPAPNHSLAFSAIVAGQGGVDQGAQQLSIFSDYENTDQAVGDFVESNVYHEQTVAAADTGKVWIFTFNAKRGNIAGSSTAAAFIKTLNPSAGYALTNFVTVDMTAIDTTWGGYSVQLAVDTTLVGQLFQFGFMNTVTNYEGSGIYYDNLNFDVMTQTAVPDRKQFVGATLQQNFPNPFHLSTRIAFTVEKPSHVDLSVFDLAGRRVATLREGDFAEGSYEVTWNGRTDTGARAATGAYWYVLQTPTGRVAQRMTLLK